MDIRTRPSGFPMSAFGMEGGSCADPKPLETLLGERAERAPSTAVTHLVREDLGL